AAPAVGQTGRAAGAAPSTEPGALLRAARRRPAIVRGIVPTDEAQVSVFADKMVQGRLDQLVPGSYNIVLGIELAAWLGVGVGDKVIVTTSFQSTPMGGIPQLKRFTVSGIFEAGYQEYDKGMAVVAMEDIQRVTRMGEGVTGVRLRMHDMDQAFDV